MEPTLYRQGGITILSKHNPSKRAGKPSRIALVLAGGAVAGGAFKAGGLRALDELLWRRRSKDNIPKQFRLSDFDIFIGLSAGSLLASALSSGIEADEIYRIALEKSTRFQSMKPLDFMRPNLFESPARIGFFLKKSTEIMASYLRRKNNPRTGKPFTLGETILKLTTVAVRIVPTGVFDPKGIRDYLRRQIKNTGLADNFRDLQRIRGKTLYVTAVDINSGTQVVFGPDEHYENVPISDAVSASCGLPGWYRTVRIKNPRAKEKGERRFLDLADGGMVRTANVGVAMRHGHADLVVVYNPFTPISYSIEERSLYEHGAYALANQLFRIVLGSRLDIGKQKILFDRSAQSDVVYVEPHNQDLDFFVMNPLNFWAKDRAAEHGYKSVRSAFAESYDPLQQVFLRHGIELAPPPSQSEFTDETPLLDTADKP